MPKKLVSSLFQIICMIEGHELITGEAYNQKYIFASNLGKLYLPRGLVFRRKGAYNPDFTVLLRQITPKQTPKNSLIRL